MSKLNKKDIDKLLEGTNSVIIATTNGSGIVADGFMALNLLSNLIHNFKECGIEERDIKRAVDLGIHGVGIQMDKMDKKAMNKMAKEFMKDLKDILSEVLDEEDKD